jgi:hypothetical protein
MSSGHLEKNYPKVDRLSGIKMYDLPYPALLFIQEKQQDNDSKVI